MSKRFSIPDCPRLSKYDGMGMAGAGMIYAEKERKRREQEDLRNSNQYNEPSENGKHYWMGYLKGFIACKDLAYKHMDRIDKKEETLEVAKSWIDFEEKSIKGEVEDFCSDY